MKIRKATKKDLDRIAVMGVDYGKYEHEIDKSQKVGTLKEEKAIILRFFKAKAVEWFLLDDNSKVVGFVAVSVDRRGKIKKGVFHTIFIEKEYRGKGLGTRLLNYALNYLKKKGCSSVSSHVFPKNSRSLKLYKKMGFGVEKSSGFSIEKKLK